MSKKQKYRAKPQHLHDNYYVADERGRSICIAFTLANARKITRALNAMESKPKSTKWKFDWALVPSRFRWAAMDSSGFWYGYERKPVTCHDEAWGNGTEGWGSLTYLLPKYPGDWRDSLQKRPGK